MTDDDIALGVSDPNTSADPKTMPDDDFVEPEVKDGASDNVELSWSAFKDLWFKGAGFLMCNLAAVYFLEYCITTAFT